MLRLGRDELKKYDCFEARDGEVIGVPYVANRFHLTVQDKMQPFQYRYLLFALGLMDEVPLLPGIKPLYGISVFRCTICNAWDIHD